MKPNDGWVIVTKKEEAVQGIDLEGRLFPSRFTLGATFFFSKPEAIAALQRCANFRPNAFEVRAARISFTFSDLHGAKPSEAI